MSSDKPNFLAQPVVKNVFMFRNGDPYFEARRIVINQKRVSNFETLLREVTGGIQAPFGAVRNIYTPRGGHRVECLESLQSGEQYVAAGRERFKKLNYQQISSRKKRLLHTLPMQARPLPHNRITVSARFLKPIKEPCTIFVVANGDVLNPAMRILIHQRMLSQFDRVLEMITDKMGLRVLGGVRSLYTYEGHQVADGSQLESGQLYVAVGRERFKKLMYSDLLFTKPRESRRVNGMKAYSLPPIYRFSKQNGDTSPSKSKSKSQCSESRDEDSKVSPPVDNGNSKEHLVSIVREISQARLISLRKRRSGQSVILGNSDNDDLELKIDDANTDVSADANADVNTDEEVKGEIKEEVTDEAEQEVKSEEQETSNSNSDETQTSEKVEDGRQSSSEGEKDEQETNVEEEKKDTYDGNMENISNDENNDTKENDNGRSSSSNSNQEEDVRRGNFCESAKGRDG
ncbi:hypothetical protein Q5P01_010969 [Channa striata]|uniref:Doublecortin domain-containing protein 2 n=1 Tax=Channa striata TaxID=64152 RepID=A0AA88MW42_CHASR|nr:hypothetical protein Q5P01_010969 [Channa striata]